MARAEPDLEDAIRIFKRDFQAEINTLQAAQNALSERLSRFERRQDDDSRLKTVWSTPGHYSSGLPTSTPLETHFNPAAEAFKNFDQQQGAAMMGTLTLETDDEPRRGASRANSVRFDDSVLRFSHSSRASSEIFGPRMSGPVYPGGVPTERSSSHKSDGRQSSLAQSIRSNRSDSGLGDHGALNGLPRGPQPGLRALGPLPSILRCWLTSEFSSDTLVYAAVCSGSFRSTITSALLSRLHIENELHILEGKRYCSLKLFLAEASVMESSSRFMSTDNEVPFVMGDFLVVEAQPEEKNIPVIIGSDILRRQSADLLLSQDRLSIIDENGSKLFIPLVRPENTTSYSSLVTLAQSKDFGVMQPMKPTTSQQSEQEIPGNISLKLQTLGNTDFIVESDRFPDPDRRRQSSALPDRSDAFSSATWRTGRPKQDTTLDNSIRAITQTSTSRVSTSKPMKVLKSSRNNPPALDVEANLEPTGWRQREATNNTKAVKSRHKSGDVAAADDTQEATHSVAAGAGLAFDWLST